MALKRQKTLWQAQNLWKVYKLNNIDILNKNTEVKTFKPFQNKNNQKDNKNNQKDNKNNQKDNKNNQKDNKNSNNKKKTK